MPMATTAEELVRRVAREHAAEQPALAGAILDRLRETLPEFFADEDVAFDMAVAVRANVDRVHRLLAGGPGTTRSDALPTEAADLLQSTLQHGIPLISLLEAYRAAQGLSTDWWLRRLERHAPPSVLPEATRTLQGLIVAYVDAAAVEIRTHYELERSALETSADGRRAHLVRKLLAGEALDAGAAARTLNHPLDGRHLALVLWRARDDAPDGALDDALARIARALEPARLLTTAARHRVYAWLSTRAELDPSPVRELELPPGVGAATSAVHAGTEGFVRAHEEATRTAALVRDGGDAHDLARVATFERFELVSLLAREPEACARFVRRVLGPLADDTRRAATARRTLQAYLAAGSSVSRAAQRLGVHRNTVAYRLQGLAGVLDDLGEEAAPGQASRRLELELALHLTEQLGPPG